MPKAHNPHKPTKREGQQISFWLVPSKEGSTEHDYLLRWVKWWREQRLDLSNKARIGLLILAYIEAGDIEGFLSKIPASFYNQLAQRISPTVIMSATPPPIPATPQDYTPLKNGGIETAEIDIEAFMSQADDDLDALFD